jgi:predicted AAA+ superfamily ATPase
MRYLAPEITRFLAEETKMAFIAGPRQVGKTTLAKYLLSKVGMEAFYFNWDIESHRKAIIKNPEDFWKRAAPLLPGRKYRISLDEIHKYPRWKRFLKGLYDATGKDIEILSTGSGRLDIYQRGGDSFQGTSRSPLECLQDQTRFSLQKSSAVLDGCFAAKALGSERLTGF